METFAWILLPIVASFGSALIVYLIMLGRMDTVIAQEREVRAEAQALLKTHERMADERVKAAEQAGRRAALEEFLSELRLEERQFLKEHKALLSRKKVLVLQERLSFRGLPLSDWTSREVTVEDGSSVQSLVESASSWAGLRLLPKGQDPC